MKPVFYSEDNKLLFLNSNPKLKIIFQKIFFNPLLSRRFLNAVQYGRRCVYFHKKSIRKLNFPMQNEIYFDNDQEEIPRTVRRRKKQLYESIRERMEFYFSDANLQKDRFLSKLIQEDPQVDLAIFLRFNKIQQLTNSFHDLKKALKKSEFLELNEEKTKVFRKTPIKEKTNVDACTIYVEQLSWDVDHDWLKLIFSRYGKVDYISIPKYKHSGKIKGFAFVEFETPEAANAALEEFERKGCCLTNSMNPEKLCSIATFEDDKHDKNQLGQLANDTTKTNKFQSTRAPEENEIKAGTKRRHEESTDNETESPPEEKKSKKMNSKKSTNENPVSEVESIEEEVNENDRNESQDEHSMAMNDVPTKKKKNRKKKKSLKTKPVKDVKMYGLQILSKADWKRLRNKYLNVQKEKMKKLKQHLYRNQINLTHKHQQQQITNQTMEPPTTKPRFTFSKRTVVKVVFDEPFKDTNRINQFKCDAKSLNKVEYVDVKVGSNVGYIRFGDENVADEVVRSKPWENVSVLEGQEEEEYWEKMKRDRCEKFENKKKFNKKRGRNKILDKTEKLMSKRIRLSVDE